MKKLIIIAACIVASVSARSFEIPSNPVEREVWFNEPWLVERYVDVEEQVCEASQAVSEQEGKQVVKEDKRTLSSSSSSSKTEKNDLAPVEIKPLTLREALCATGVIGIIATLIYCAHMFEIDTTNCM